MLLCVTSHVPGDAGEPDVDGSEGMLGSAGDARSSSRVQQGQVHPSLLRIGFLMDYKRLYNRLLLICDRTELKCTLPVHAVQADDRHVGRLVAERAEEPILAHRERAPLTTSTTPSALWMMALLPHSSSALSALLRLG